MATYVRENDDWAITVSGQGKELTARAPGIIAARDRTDQLVDKLGPGAKGATVVHLLNGSALEFTSMYMTARLARPEPAPLEVPEPKAEAEPAQTAKATETAEATEEAVVPAQQDTEPDPAPAASKPQPKARRRPSPKAKLTADIGDALETPKKPATPRRAASRTVKTASTKS